MRLIWQAKQCAGLDATKATLAEQREGEIRAHIESCAAGGQFQDSVPERQLQAYRRYFGLDGRAR